MMRELAQSRAIVAVLTGLFVLSMLGAIPVPAFTISKAKSWDEAHSSYCSCASCSPTSCCCAMLAPDDDDTGVTMLGYSCHPKVSWFLAVLPPATGTCEAEAASLPMLDISRCDSALLSPRTPAIGVPTPPPKRAA